MNKTQKKKGFVVRNGIGLLCIIVLLLNTITFVHAESNKKINVIINNEEISFAEPPIAVDGRILVPFRAIFEELGFDVAWDSNEKRASGSNGNQTVSFVIDDPNMDIEYTGSTKLTKKIDVPAKAENGRTYIPLRALSESIGAKVEWDNASYTVNISFEQNVSEDIEYEESINIFENNISFEEYMSQVDDKFDCGYDFAVFVSNTASLFAWGNNDCGQLISEKPVLNEPTIVERNVRKACCMGKNTIVLYLDGSVSVYGENAVDKLFKENITDITTGEDILVALDKDGKTYIWGSGAAKALAKDSLATDEPIAFLENIKSIDSNKTTVALWGNDNYLSIAGNDNSKYTYTNEKTKLRLMMDTKNFGVYKTTVPVDSYILSENCILVSAEGVRKMFSKSNIKDLDINEMDLIGKFSTDVLYAQKDGNLYLSGNICNSNYRINECVLEDVVLVDMMDCGTYVIILEDGSIWTFGVAKNGSLGSGKKTNSTFPELLGYIDTSAVEVNKYGIEVEVVGSNCYSDEYVIEVAFSDKEGQPVTFYGLAHVVIVTEHGDLYEKNHFIDEKCYQDGHARISLNPKQLLSKVPDGVVGIMFAKANTVLYAYGDVDELPQKSDKGSGSSYISGSAKDHVESKFKESNKQKYEYYDSIVKSLEQQLRNIMNERKTRVYSNGKWIYTYDHNAANAIQNDIDYYKRLRDTYK